MTFSADDEDEAARWAIRLDGTPLGKVEQANLDAWLDADPRRRGALLRAEAALSLLTRARALADTAGIPPQHGGPPWSRRALVAGSISGLFACLALGTWYRSAPEVDTETAVGELSRVSLADGSSIVVNTDSRLTASLLPNRRSVKLKSGEAWFQVAHDRTRPFIVEAGGVRVKAVGTAFAVRRRPDGADVLVTEGVVEVWSVGRENDRMRVAAGSWGSVADDGAAVKVVDAAGEVERLLAWRGGQLALDGETLAYAASELNRYNTRKIVIADEPLGRATLVGYFRVDRPEDFARAVAKITGARVEDRGGDLVLER